MKRLLAEKTLEVDFFKGALQKSRGSTAREERLWRTGIYDYIRDVMALQGGLRIERMCAVVGVSRAGFYRYLRQRDAWDEEMGVRSEVQNVVLEHQGRFCAAQLLRPVLKSDRPER